MTASEFTLNNPSPIHIKSGKVREVYAFNNHIFLIATDRISAFDIIMPFQVPFKGAVLTGLSAFFLERARKICPVWLDRQIHPNVLAGKKCEPIKIEVIVRGYIAGSMWRKYKNGQRIFCGNKLPDNLIENQKLQHPIITPTTKSDTGHDEDITPQEIIQSGLLSSEEWEKISNYAIKLFEDGSQYALTRNLLLVDTKYEFGFYYTPDNKKEIYLIDEVHTPDSSRYFYASEYEKNFKDGKPQRHLSKEVLREFLLKHGVTSPEAVKKFKFSEDVIQQISNTYLQVYELLTGQKLDIPHDTPSINDAIEKYIASILKNHRLAKTNE